MATSTTTTSTTTSSARPANRRARRFTTVAAFVAAYIALGACNTTPSATGPANSSSKNTEKAGTLGNRTSTELTVGTSSGGSVSTSFSATKAVNAGRIDLEESTDSDGEKVLVPRVRGVASDGSGDIETQRVLRRRGEAPMKEDTGNWSSMYEFVEFVIQANDEYWTQVFSENGLAEPMVNYIIPEPGVTYQTYCGPTDDDSMFYCPGDDTIAFSQSIATRLWDGTYVGPDGQRADGQIGDFATALLASHEVSHSVQNELGFNSTNVSIPMLEQHADCWSGVFTAYAETQGMLDAGDLTEGVIGAYMVGDSNFDSPTHHGTSSDRIVAFATGYNGGSPSACNAYLPL